MGISVRHFSVCSSRPSGACISCTGHPFFIFIIFENAQNTGNISFETDRIWHHNTCWCPLRALADRLAGCEEWP